MNEDETSTGAGSERRQKRIKSSGKRRSKGTRTTRRGSGPGRARPSVGSSRFIMLGILIAITITALMIAADWLAGGAPSTSSPSFGKVKSFSGYDQSSPDAKSGGDRGGMPQLGGSWRTEHNGWNIFMNFHSNGNMNIIYYRTGSSDLHNLIRAAYQPYEGRKNMIRLEGRSGPHIVKMGGTRYRSQSILNAVVEIHRRNNRLIVRQTQLMGSRFPFLDNWDTVLTFRNLQGN